MERIWPLEGMYVIILEVICDFKRFVRQSLARACVARGPATPLRHRQGKKTHLPPREGLKISFD